jgi:hypothetical protein
MTDTPKHIKELQLQLWLAKTPGERLLQFITDNDVMFQGLIEFKKQLINPIKKTVLDNKSIRQN